MAITTDALPTADEAAMARLSYLDWERSQAEELSEYIYRRRAVDLSLLIGEAIRNELTKAEQTAIGKYYYEQKPLTLIASELELNKATVNRTLARAEEKLRRALSYTVKYQYNLKNVEFLPLAIREALAVDAMRCFSPRNLGERLKRLRCCENISIQLLSGLLGISAEHIGQYERGEAMPTAQEIVELSGFFKTTADYLLTGGKKDEQQQNT